MMNSAATIFHSDGHVVLTFQDIMDQGYTGYISYTASILHDTPHSCGFFKINNGTLKNPPVFGVFSFCNLNLWDLKESPPEESGERVVHDAIKRKYQEEEPIVEDVVVAKSVGSYSDYSNMDMIQSSQVGHRECAELTPLAIIDKEVASARALQDVAYRKTESVDSVEKSGSVEGESQTEKDGDEETDSWEVEKPRDAGKIGLSGLGRAARRQLADVKLTSVALKVSAGVTGSSGYFPSVSEAGSAFVGNSGVYVSPSRQRMTSTAESPYGFKVVSSMWSTRTPYLDGYLQKPPDNVLDPVERRYSSLCLPTSSEDLDHQPRTVHGYQLASDPLSYTLGQKLQNWASHLHSSAMHNPAISRTRELQAERPYNDQYSSGASESFNTLANTKTYHSLPDISGLVVPRRSPYENRNSKWKGPLGFKPTAYKAAYEKSMYSTTGSREQPCPSKHYRYSLSTQLSHNSDAKSLWSKQPFEQVFGVAGNNCDVADGVSPHEPFAALHEVMRMELEKELNGGADEDLIDGVAARERLLYEADSREPSQAGRVYESQFLSTD
ncbi:hypothetical protein Scep_030224 [Stephania cephalantha]|uniref:Uncharacterized protein n=1 Tax=Stephania cephalantha TaxID=152367 RepID=A0AAP0E6Y1_9MAGN